LDSLITDSYKQQLIELHGDRYWGGTGRQHAEEILKVAKEYECETALDYGSSNHKDCLKRHFHRKYPGQLLFYEYDPAVESKSGLPQPADIVVCTDVLEHIEPELLDNVLTHMNSCMEKCGYFVVSTILAKQVLSDGRNAHLIVEDKEWWKLKLLEHFNVQGMKWTKNEVRATVCKK
tara:strand:+ start:284 stop:814 length:531 start_codon:yes stop_codon:yes gene_type:complete